MSYWFDEKDSLKTVKDHIGGKHTPDSIKREAREEYRRRMRREGVPEQEIRRRIYDLED